VRIFSNNFLPLEGGGLKVGVAVKIFSPFSPSPIPSPLKGEGKRRREARKVTPQGRGGKEEERRGR